MDIDQSIRKAIKMMRSNQYMQNVTENILQDVRHFSQLHSWYKHLPEYPCTIFYAVPMMGQVFNGIYEPMTSENELEYGPHWRYLNSIQLEEVELHIPTHVLIAVKKFPCRANKYLQQEYTDLVNQTNQITNQLMVDSSWQKVIGI
jgi:hypothetical protein